MTNQDLGHKKVISNLTDKYLWQNRELLVFFCKEDYCVYLRVTSNPKRQHDRQLTNSKMTDKMTTLRKIKRAASQRTSRHKLQHILFCPTAPKPTHHPTSGRLTN